MALNAEKGQSTCISAGCTMGYSVVTRVRNTEFRYTAWVQMEQVRAYRSPCRTHLTRPSSLPNPSSACVLASTRLHAHVGGLYSLAHPLSCTLSCTISHPCAHASRRQVVPDWDDVVAAELYDHSTGSENENLAGTAEMAKIEAELFALLKRGPQTSGGWGPWQSDN